MSFRRESGLLLHPTSLPGPHGIGDIGVEAHRWIDALAEAGQRLWQVLPLGPTGYRDSPYQNLSTFAAGTHLISLEALVEHGLLESADLTGLAFAEGSVDFGPVLAARAPLLHRAASRFHGQASDADRRAYHEFRARHAAWLDDWALFAAIKQAQGGGSWTEWPAALRDREPGALAGARDALRDSIEEKRVLQFLFDEQWQALRSHAQARGVRIIGDIPIFVAHDSADVWQRRELFHLDADGQSAVIAGVPPDYFSETGQRWGNPLYAWEAHAAEGYAWWTARLRRVLELVDIVRIDHFRGFAAYWEIPASEPTAVNGRWVQGPGRDLFDAMHASLGKLPVIAEDLGLITPDVAELRDDLGLPGMRVFEFGFAGDRDNPHLPENYVENCVAYTGTHDNETLAGWIAGGGGGTQSAWSVARERARLRRYVRRRRDLSADLVWACIELVLRSRAAAAVIPLQDVLGLGPEARMNTPGTAEGNWSWRVRPEALQPSVWKRLREASVAAHRNEGALPKPTPDPRSPTP